MTTICITCNKEFKIKPYQVNTRKYCSFKCYYPHRLGVVPVNKGKRYTIPSAHTGKTITCKYCGKEKYFELNQLKKRPCEYCSVQCAKKASRKKELKIYSSIHARIKVEWGKAILCEEADEECSNIFDWANISGKYLLVREDWKQLCRKHHIRYDTKRGISAYKNFITL